MPSRLPRAMRPTGALGALFTTILLANGWWPSAHAQSGATPLPGITIEPKAQPVRRKPAAAPTTTPQTTQAQTESDTVLAVDATQRAGSLTVPTTSEVQRELARVPGSVVVVPDTAYRTTTPASTIKDVLDYVPGVFVQPKWGDDSRLSIRGSGLSRNFHLRGIQLYMDGIPISTADGFGDFQELDPTAYRYVEVYKGANALRLGASENSYAAAAAFDAKLQTATTFELGTRGRRPDVTWDLALYRAYIENELQCSFPFGVPDFCVVRNADKTIHPGVEAAFGAAVLKSMFVPGERPDRLWLNVAYTFSDFRFDNDPVYGNHQLPGAPRHFLRAELLYRHPGGIYFGPNIEWVPEAYFVGSANTLDTEAYAILKAGYDPGTGFSVYVEARNLSDTHYIASTGITNVADPATTRLFEPGTGRAAFAGVKVAW